MSAYYYLMSGVPEIKISDSKVKYDIDDIVSHIMGQLSSKDVKAFNYLVYQNDNKNLVRCIAKSKGLFSPYADHITPCVFAEEILEKSEVASDLPRYMVMFLEDSKLKDWNNVRELENYLLSLYYEEMLASDCKFIKRYASYMRDLKNVLAALNARSLEFTPEAIAKELVGDYSLIPSLVKSNAADFGVGRELPYIVNIIEAFNESDIADPFHIENTEFNLVNEFLNQEIATKSFQLENVFAYYISLYYAHRLTTRDEEAGKARIDELINLVKEEVSK